MKDAFLKGRQCPGMSVPDWGAHGHTEISAHKMQCTHIAVHTNCSAHHLDGKHGPHNSMSIMVKGGHYPGNSVSVWDAHTKCSAHHLDGKHGPHNSMPIVVKEGRRHPGMNMSICEGGKFRMLVVT